MIARTEPRPKHLSTRALHATFLTMLPAIRRLALIAFRDLDPEAKQEAVQEVTANAFVAVHRLAELGKADLAYPSVLAKYAICQCCTGRKVGSKLNTNDVLSPYAQQRKHIQVGRLDHFDKDDESWREIVVEDKRATPADIVATRIDFATWLHTLSQRDRKVASTLATGESTAAVAKRFRVSPSRISQLRGELKESWEEFVGDVT